MQIQFAAPSDFAKARPGIYQGVPEATYHALKETPKGEPILSNSKLGMLTAHSPKKVKLKEDRGDEFKDEFRLGSLTHQMLLEPDKMCLASDFRDEDTASPDHTWCVISGARRGKAYAEMKELYGPEQIVTEKEYTMAEWMCLQATQNEHVKAILSKPRYTEVSVIAVDEKTGLTLKGRIDILLHTADTVDVKTTRHEATKEAFESSVAEYGYDTQHAIYHYILGRNGLAPATHTIIPLSKVPPHLPGVFVYGFEARKRAGKKVRALIDTYAACRERGEWPDAPVVIYP